MPYLPKVHNAKANTKHAHSTPERRGTAHERGYNYKWQQARLIHLETSPLCKHCYKENRVTAADTVDHIIPHKGDMRLFWDRANWQSLCKRHHDIKTGQGL